ncbi:MAG: hypothetical protein IJ226_00690 [Clostridia bacterium]|nr:hypothetical protein [Clostridia bacterium]
MTKSVKILIAVLVCSVIATGAVLGGVFGARAVADKRHREEEQAAYDARREATASVEREFLLGINENWSAELSTEELKQLEDAGDYVVFKSWTELVKEELFDSGLQTAKITALADALKSEQGQKLFEDFENNAELLIPLIRGVGFTSSDVSDLVYSLLCAFVDKGGEVLKSARDTLVSIKTETNAVNVNKNLAAVNSELEYLNFSAEEKSEILADLADAENAIKELASFAYTTSVTTLTDKMVEIIASEDGALSDITDGEIQAVVDAMLGNVRDLKTSMTSTEIAKLNKAIKTITDNFDGNPSTSRIFSQIVSYARFAYVITDSIPYLTSMVIASAEAVDTEFLTDVRTYVDYSPSSNDDLKLVNISVISAKILKALYENIDRADLTALLETLETQAKTDYRRALPIVALDFYFNIMAYNDETEEVLHPDIIDNDTFYDETMYFLTYGLLSNFERTYYDYLAGSATLDDVRKAANACPFDKLGITNPYSRETNTREWFEYYMTETGKALSATATAIAPTRTADLVACIDDYYADGSAVKSDTIRLADMPLIAPLAEDATDEQKQEYEDLIAEYAQIVKSSRAFGLAFILQEVFA